MDSFYGDSNANTSGQGENSIVPQEIQKWNWGAFFLSWIWGIGNQVWISFLTFIPFVGFIMPFVLGAKGSEWAWKSKEWDSVEHFQEVQKKWAKWGFIIFIAMMIIMIFLIVLIFAIPLMLGYSLFESTQDINTLPTTPTMDTYDTY